MVDMSPEAVSQRLRLTGKLCDMNFRLMNPENETVNESQGETGETELVVGTPTVVGSESPVSSFAVFFGDDGETGYPYAVDSERESPVLDAMHIYDVESVRDKDRPSVVQFQWANDGLKGAFLINSYIHAVVDFEAQRGYCRTGFPPATHWSRGGHQWTDEALSFFD